MQQARTASPCIPPEPQHTGQLIANPAGTRGTCTTTLLAFQQSVFFAFWRAAAAACHSGCFMCRFWRAGHSEAELLWAAAPPCARACIRH